MAAFTHEMARQYYNTLNAAQKEQIGDQINNEAWAVEWLTNAVNAGVPGAIKATGSYTDPEGGNNENETGDAGVRADWQDAAEPEEWLGKRAPTPRELRKWAAYQHQGYISGDKSMQDEDYERFSDRVLASLIKKTWDVSGGKWKPGGGNPWAEYDDDGKLLKGPGGETPGGPGPSGGGKPAEPAKPVTYTEGDKQLSYTGNPLVDNMIQMFNQAQGQRKIVEGGGDVDQAQLGHFARGENMQVGGGDDLSKLAGMLMGTGGNAFLWTAVDDEAFGGLKGQWSGAGQEKAKNKAKAVAGPSVAAVADPTPPPVDQTTQQVVEQEPATPKIPSYKLDQIENRFGRGPGEGSPFFDMLNKNYGGGSNPYVA